MPHKEVSSCSSLFIFHEKEPFKLKFRNGYCAYGTHCGVYSMFLHIFAFNLGKICQE
jgi:hypothetical protein